MAKFLRLFNGVPRHFDEAATTTIYDQELTVVSGSPANGNQIQATAGNTIPSGTSITLPQSGTYSGAELQILLNGQMLEAVFDYNYVGVGTRTQVQFTFDLVVGDRINFRIDRAA